MKAKIYHRGTHYHSRKLALLHFQKRLIEAHYTFLKCQIKANVLICTGWLYPNYCSEPYKIRIEYVVGMEPKTTIREPFIHPEKKIHMYRDHSVCLHYPPDMPWDEKTEVYKYTVPWVSEWILYHEIFKLSGKWEGPESPAHFRERDKNTNVDVGD